MPWKEINASHHDVLWLLQTDPPPAEAALGTQAFPATAIPISCSSHPVHVD